MQFPALTRSEICRKDDDGTPPVVLDSFMDLRHLDLTRVPLSQSFVPTKAVLVIPEIISGITETAFVCHSPRLSLSTFGKLPILATSHPIQSSLASPHWRGSKGFPWNSNPLYLALTSNADVLLRPHALSPLLSWPGSMPLYSTTCK
jgi:hypothetical protein